MLIDEVAEAIRNEVYGPGELEVHRSEDWTDEACAALAVVEKWLREKARDYKHADCSGASNCTEPVCVRLLLEQLADELEGRKA